MSFIKCGFLLILTFAFLISIEGKGGFRSSGGYRSRSSSSSGGGWSSYSSSRRATASPSYSRSYASAAPTYRSSNVGTQRAVHQATTPRYVVRTQPTAQRSPSQGYPSQSHTTQRSWSGHSTPRSSYYPTQSSYPRNNYNPPSYGGGHYNQPNYGYGGYRPNYQNSYNSYSPHYTPSYSKYPNLYQPVGKYKDHSVRNSVIAGLGGSALGMYLGYKLGSYTSGMHQPMGGYGNPGGYYSGGSGYGGMPSYSVVHHYHHGEKPIPQNFEVQSNIVSPCGSLTNFCTSNTTPLCLTNGTIYCTAPISATASCNETTLTHLPCLNTTISVPCVNTSDPNCHSGKMLDETVAIPCISNISVYGDFATNKLQVHALSGDNPNSDTTITGQGIRNNFCITVIADPVKMPEKMNNNEFLWYLEDNPKEKEGFQKKTEGMWGNVLNFMFY